MELSGGQAVVDRLLKIYGFSTKKELGDYFGLGNGTVSAWIKRNHFPGEQVVRCALEKKASLLWLATGAGNMYSEPEMTMHDANDSISLDKKNILEGQLISNGKTYIDRSLIGYENKNLQLVKKNKNNWVVDSSVSKISSGRWLLDIDSDIDVYDVSRVPGNRIQVYKNSFVFECSIDDIKVLGMVLLTINKNE
jgi:hypothetical protein